MADLGFIIKIIRDKNNEIYKKSEIKSFENITEENNHKIDTSRINILKNQNICIEETDNNPLIDFLNQNIKTYSSLKLN